MLALALAGLGVGVVVLVRPWLVLHHGGKPSPWSISDALTPYTVRPLHSRGSLARPTPGVGMALDPGLVARTVGVSLIGQLPAETAVVVISAGRCSVRL